MFSSARSNGEKTPITGPKTEAEDRRSVPQEADAETEIRVLDAYLGVPWGYTPGEERGGKQEWAEGKRSSGAGRALQCCTELS